MPITRRPPPRAAVSRAWLDVPYSDRHLVKKLGALWDPASRRRYAPVPGLPALRPWRRLPQSVPGEDRGYGQVNRPRFDRGSQPTDGGSHGSTEEVSG